MRRDFDTIVLGCGGIGSAALYWLSQRLGRDVLGIEQFELFHSRGGSQDHSRIIRLAYHDASYARLMPFSYHAWQAVAEAAGIDPVTRTGGLQLAFADSPYVAIVEQYAAAMEQSGIAYDRLDSDELRYRFPQFEPQRPVIALYQEQTGIVDPSRGNAIHVALARANGAAIHAECPVTQIEADPGGAGLQVHTAQGVFSARRLVVAAGAWTQQALGWLGLRIPITVTQEQVTYYSTPHLKDFGVGAFPVFQWKDARSYYGFPIYGEVATKAAIDASGPAVTPETRTTTPDAAREGELESFLSTNIPHFVGPKLHTKTCLYDMPPDRNFILGALPEHPQILAFCGAAHAYKFASLIGQILSELALDGATRHDIAAFALDRPALTDPAYTPNMRI
jgi:sarcosine oxidase